MLSKVLGFFGLSAGGFYAIAGVLVVIAGLAGTVYVQSLRLDAAKSENRALQKDKDDLINDLSESERGKAEAIERAKRTDAALVEKDKRLAVLLETERNLRAEFNRIKERLEKADQDCMDRRLPDAIASRLRDGTVGRPEDGKGSGPEIHDDAVPQVAAP